MDFSKCNLKKSYRSYGTDPIVKNIIPLLSGAKTYKRAVGFFSTSAFSITEKHLKDMVENGGEIYVITSPILSKEDVEAIMLGEKLKEKVLEETFISEFELALNSIEGNHQKMIMELIAKNKFKIKIVTTKRLGQYHDKLGIIEDHYGNTVVFTGSSNESYNGLVQNYEKIRLDFSWDYSSEEVEEEINEFNELWGGTNPDLETHSFTAAINKSIIKIRERNELDEVSSSSKKILKPRPYQEEAMKSWKDLNYNGFFLMATGTGKTLTTLFGIQQLMVDEGNTTVVISAPYIHLLSQWKDDVVKLFPESVVVLCSSANPNWVEELTKTITRQKLTNIQLFVIVTQMSLDSDKFKNIMNRCKFNKLLVIDEAHRFTNKIYDDYSIYKYKLGLSATPYSGFSKEKGEQLMDFFGGKAYEFNLEDAINSQFLVEYNYHPIFVMSNYDEEEKFRKLTKAMSSCFRNGVLISTVQKLSELKRARLRVISSVEDKFNNFEKIVENIENKTNFIVYCGDGKKSDEFDEEIRVINIVKKSLNNLDLKTSQFTSSENINDRLSRIKLFNENSIDALVAIKCLDEGINIPSIKSALILSSNDDPREFIQRRGRILRLFEDKFGNKKTIADIYDVIVLPSHSCKSIAEIEFRRFNEYNSLAKNKEDNEIILSKYCKEYDLDVEKLRFATSDYEVEDGSELDE